MGTSWVSDLMGVEDWETAAILRRGVGAGAFGSFFLWERVPLLVRCGAAATVLGGARTTGAGAEEAAEGAGRVEDRASKSER